MADPEQPIGEKEAGLPRVDDRTKAIPVIKEFIRSQESKIGDTPEQRVGWLMDISPTGLNQLLINLNGAVQGIQINTFDGQSSLGGAAKLHIPPEPEDKEPLLHYALSEMQEKAKQMTASGSSFEDVLNIAAVVLPTIVDRLHLFYNGNGRTSRILRMLIRDGFTNIDAGIDIRHEEEPTIRTLVAFERHRITHQRESSDESFSALTHAFEEATSASLAAQNEERAATIAARYIIDAEQREDQEAVRQGVDVYKTATFNNDEIKDILQREKEKERRDQHRHWLWHGTTPDGENYSYLALPNNTPSQGA